MAHIPSKAPDQPTQPTQSDQLIGIHTGDGMFYLVGVKKAKRTVL